VTVTQLITVAFKLAASRHPELYRTWVTISHRAGSLLPDSMLAATIQRTGEIDMVLRCMEDEFSPAPEGAGEADIFSFNYQKMLSELWVGAVYEIFRVLTCPERKLVLDSNVSALARDLKLLRIPLEKYEIADHKNLEMERHPPKSDETDIYHYSKNDPKRRIIMPSKISSRGSVMWHVIDVKKDGSRWLERRALSERIVSSAVGIPPNECSDAT